MAGQTGDTRTRVAALLAAGVDRGTLWRELADLSRARDFVDTADLWAPALYERDAAFFEPALLKYLRTANEATIRALLPRCEAAGQAALFTGLYRKITDAADWNRDVLALAQSATPDDGVERALALRAPDDDDDFSLDEETALALYRRNPRRFSGFVRDHIHYGWRNKATYPQLRAEARVRGDEPLYWALFRKLAGGGGKWNEWQEALGELAKDDVPTDAIADELERRHMEQAHSLDAEVLAPFVAKYGAAVVPYIAAHRADFTAKSLAALLPVLDAHTEDEDAFWRAFWTLGTMLTWNAALQDLARQPLADADLRAALARRTPPPDGSERWEMAALTAEALYRRSPDLARPLIEQYGVIHPLTGEHGEAINLGLFVLAEQRHDEELLDFLTYRLLTSLHPLLSRAFPTPSQARYQKPDKQAVESIAHYSAAITGRFDRLAAESPTVYVEHAANTLSRFGPGETWPFRRSLEHLPVYAYLFTRHRDAWLRAPAAMRELLESPNAHVRSIGLVFLNEGSADAARRAAENVALLRAVLLDTSRKADKKLALAALERAGRVDAAAGARVLPVLEGAMHYRARHAIDERAMVSYVRLRHARTAEGVE